jgi:hypothetical protein
VNSVNDATLMQSTNCNFMKGETRGAVESPQNYGFSSVNMPPDMDGAGGILGAAEHFSSFIGGSRSFAVAQIIDDRRHRLKGCQPGDVAMFRLASDQLQLHLTQTGGFWTGPDSKKLRLQLVKAQQQQPQDGGGGSAPQVSKGQQPIYNQDSSQYVEVNGTMTQSVNKQHQIVLTDKDTGIEVNPDNNVYLGAIKSGSILRSGTFGKVAVWQGNALVAAENVFGLISGGGGGGGGPGGGGGGNIVTSSSPPLNIDNLGNMALSMVAPLFTNLGGALALTTAPSLSLIGGALALTEPPNDGTYYGRLGNGTWANVLPTSGGSLTGPLILAADPTVSLGAATKEYVDSHAGVTSVMPGAGLTGGGIGGAVTIGVAVNGITNALAAQMGALTLKGNATGATANAADLSPAAVMAMLGAAPLASPAFTGAPTAPTAAPGTSTTQLATTAFTGAAVANAGSSTVPLMDGTADVGTGATYARADHVHPTDTSRAPLASPALTGTPTAPTAAPGTSTTQVASTAFVQAAISGSTAGVTSWNTRSGAVTMTLADVTGVGGAPINSPTFTGTPTGPTFVINDPAGQSRSLIGQTSGLTRWSVTVGNSTAESGSNAGSDFVIGRYNDTGAFVENPVTINRANGQINVQNSLSVNGSASWTNPGLSLSKYSGAAGSANQLTGLTGALGRWQILLGDGTAESGSNAGSNFVITRFNDAGAAIENPMTINRAGGGTTFLRGVQVSSPAAGVNPSLSLVKSSSGDAATLYGYVNPSAPLARWVVTLGDNVAESGSNAGSNFNITSYSDGGSALVTGLSIRRSDGAVQIRGTQTNDNATAGNVGEWIEPSLPWGSGSNPGFTNGVAAAIISQAPTSGGDFEVFGSITFFYTTTSPTVNYLFASLSLSSSVDVTPSRVTVQGFPSMQPFAGGGPVTLRVGPARFSMASAVPINLVGQGSFSGGDLKTQAANLIIKRIR